MNWQRRTVPCAALGPEVVEEFSHSVRTLYRMRETLEEFTNVVEGRCSIHDDDSRQSLDGQPQAATADRNGRREAGLVDGQVALDEAYA
jgi:hypothetical protein